MANQYLTTQLISNTALAEFAVNAPFVMTGSRTYQDDFTSRGYKVGDTIQVRRQNQYIVGDGSAAVVQDIIETVEDIRIEHQYHTFISYTMQDLSLRIDDFSRMFIRPAIGRIISQMEVDINRKAELQLNFFTGVPGTPLNSFASVDQAGTKLLKNTVDISNDAYLALTIEDGATLKAGLLNSFTPVLNEHITRNSAIGHLSYFDVYQSQNIVTHQAGAGPTLFFADPLLVNGAVAAGNTIVLDGATASVANYFLPGDLISIAGATNIAPANQLTTKTNAQFVVTAAASSDAGGNITVFINPTIISTALNPLQNVSNPLPDNAVVTMVQSHNVNVAYPTRGLDIVCPPLGKLMTVQQAVAVDKKTGLSLSITQQGDIDSYQNKMRIDLLCGFSWHPQYCTKLLS